MSLSVQEERALKRQYWKEQIEGWQESGLQQIEYCRQNDLKYHLFTYWKKKLVHPAESSVCLVQVPFAQTIPSRASSRPLGLVMGNGYRIEVERDFDPVALKQLIHVLERP
jgi:hypothetical protein